MIGSEALALLQSRVVRGSSPQTNLNSWLYQELNQACRRLERLPWHPWFLLSESAYEELIPGDERVAVPAEFLMEAEFEELQLFNSGELIRDLKKATYDQMKIEYGTGTGMPEKYALLGNYFRLRPIPDLNSYTVRMVFFEKSGVITPETTNVWLQNAPDLVIAEAGVVIAGVLGNAAAKTSLQELKTQELVMLENEVVARQQTNLDVNPE